MDVVGSSTLTKEKKFVRDLKEKESVQNVFLVQEKSLLTDKNGRSYISVTLSDVTGSIDGKIWERAEALAPLFQAGDFIEVKGHIQLYQNRRQMVIHDLNKASLEHINMKDFIIGATKNPHEMYEQLLSIVESIEDHHIRQLVNSVIREEQIRERLLISPAAKTIHHATIGGLLEHVLSICAVMESLAQHYPILNKDYLIFGAIFHDIGKIWELEIGLGIQYTTMGRLVGHMAIACQIIDEKAGKILGFPSVLKDELKHIVLSHHGKLEYGSPKRPKFLEALVVAMVDDLDSKINTMTGLLQAECEQGEPWTRYSQQFDRYLYLDIFRRQMNKAKK